MGKSGAPAVCETGSLNRSVRQLLRPAQIWQRKRAAIRCLRAAAGRQELIFPDGDIQAAGGGGLLKRQPEECVMPIF